MLQLESVRFLMNVLKKEHKKPIISIYLVC